MVSPLLKSLNPTIGVYAKADGIHLRLTAKAASEREASALIRPVEQQIRDLFGTVLSDLRDRICRVASLTMR